jgi:hypothetical protein
VSERPGTIHLPAREVRRFADTYWGGEPPPLQALSLNLPVSQAQGPAANLACPSDHSRITRPAIRGAPSS